MIIRVPLLLNYVDAVYYRLDEAASRAVVPPGPHTSGYDDVFREPVVSDTNAGAATGTGRVTARVEMAVLRIPCQVETVPYEALREGWAGNIPSTGMTLVFHRKDLLRLGLIDLATGNVLLHIGDRVAKLEKHNQVGVSAITLPNVDGLYVSEVRPGSWGFGVDGHDLHMVGLDPRDPGLG